MRQVPPPSASAWLFDLAAVRCPQFAVLRGDEVEARDALVDHLVEIGSVADREEAAELLADAEVGSIGVVW